MAYAGQSANAPISTIGTINSNLNSTVVPITAINFHGVGEGALQIAYDPAIVNPTAVVAGVPAMGGTVTFGHTTPGILIISWYYPYAGSVTLPDNDTIFKITFAKVGVAVVLTS